MRYLRGSFSEQNLGASLHVLGVRDKLKLDRCAIACSQDSLRVVHRGYPDCLAHSLGSYQNEAEVDAHSA